VGRRVMPTTGRAPLLLSGVGGNENKEVSAIYGPGSCGFGIWDSGFWEVHYSASVESTITLQSERKRSLNRVPTSARGDLRAQ